MKRLLVVLLLIVLTAQGIAVATGGNGVGAASGIALQAAADSAQDALDTEPAGVAADMEEMSDYVAQEPAFCILGRHAAPIRLRLPSLVSIDLPRAPPPPRA